MVRRALISSLADRSRHGGLHLRWLALGVAGLIGFAPAGGADTYQDWKTRVFTEAEQADPTISGETALSPAGDGLTNLLKYAFGIDPHVEDFLALPQIGSVQAVDPATGQMATFTTITRRVSAANPPVDLYFVPELSSDLQVWRRGDGAFAAPVTHPPGGDFDLVTSQTLLPRGQHLFLRLRVFEGQALPNDWQMEYFGQTGIDPTADPDGDGQTNFDEFLYGTDPNDYYDGRAVQMTALSGDGQAGLAGRFLAAPFVVKIEDGSGHVMANAPIAFAVVDCSGGVAGSQSGAAAQSIEMRTDGNGIARAYYLEPSGFGTTSNIRASVVSRSTVAQTMFSCTTREGLVIDPENVALVVNAAQTATVPLTIANETPETMSFLAAVENGTVANPSFTDSDQAGGPEFVWNDISLTGTHLDLVSDADDDFEAFAITFAFPYFGNSYSTIYVSSNGFLTFGAGSRQYHNVALPSDAMPPNEIAALHTDLNLGNSGDVYYQEFDDRVVIQFTDAARYAGDGHETFQIVLRRDGSILFYYLDVNGAVDQATVGIQNEPADQGLTIAYQTGYLKNHLAVRVTSSISWLSVSPANGVMGSGEVASLNVLLNQDGLTTGSYNGTVHVTAAEAPSPANFPRLHSLPAGQTSGIADVAVSMNINEAPQVTLYEPGSDARYLLGERIKITASAEDPDGIARIEFYDGSSKIAETNEAPYSFDWDAPGGNHLITVRAVDFHGAIGRSSGVSVRKDVDTDGDGLGDDWEVFNFGNLDQGAEGDWDGDGLTNLQEYAARTSPVTGDTDGDGISDWAELNTYHTNPSARDSDGDGMDDAWELAHSLDPLQNDSALDPDNDGLTNLEEFKAGSDPANNDSDGDGVVDGKDGWPGDPDITLPRAPDYHYAAIGLGLFAPTALNNAGVVVGDGQAELYGQPYMWKAGNLSALPVPTAATVFGNVRMAFVTGVNAEGTICGRANYSSPTIQGDGFYSIEDAPFYHAFKWPSNGGAPIDLGDLTHDDSINNEAPWPGTPDQEHGYPTPDGTNLASSFASGINASGTVVGRSATYVDVHRYAPWFMAAQSMDLHAAAWAGGEKTDFGTLQGGGHLQRSPAGNWIISFANAINDAGVIVGESTVNATDATGHWTTHAFKSGANGLVDLGTLGGNSSRAKAMSNDGQIVGISEFDAAHNQGAFVVSPGKSMKGLSNPPIGDARGVNALGQVIGNAVASGMSLAVLWQNGVGLDLQPRAGGIRLYGALAIADNGCITATGTSASGDSTAFLLVPVALAVDANRDGVIKFSDNFDDPDLVGNALDETSEATPYRFWLNDDQDAGPIPIEGDRVPVVTPDYALHEIMSKRNLEDFSRLWIFIGGLHDAIASGQIHVGLRWKNVTPGTAPAINIYQSADGEGSDSYLKDEAAAQAQIAGEFNEAVSDVNNVQTIGPATLFVFKSSYWNDLSPESTTKALLFEGVAEGKGELEIVFLDQANHEIGRGGSLWLDLKDIKKMYQRASATPDPLTPLPYRSSSSVFDESAINYSPDVTPRFEVSWDETQQCLVFVHGWGMTYDRSINFGETMFKRLWWQGFKGRFATFRWATETSNFSYNTSEWLAWKYGKSLKNYVENYLKHQMPDYTLAVAAHSMGNIVTGSALKRGMTLNTYMLMEAALPSGCYNDSVNNYNRFLTAETTSPTPDTQAQKGYRLLLESVVENVGKFVSFFNIDDYALATGTTSLLGWPYQTNWEKNEVDYKPNRFSETDSFGGDYLFSPNSPVGNQVTVNWNRTLSGGYSVSRIVSDIHESLAFAARPRSKAAGAEPHNATVFGSVLNLESSCGFGADYNDHGGQFMRSIQGLQPFYTRMAEELKQ